MNDIIQEPEHARKTHLNRLIVCTWEDKADNSFKRGVLGLTMVIESVQRNVINSNTNSEVVNVSVVFIMFYLLLKCQILLIPRAIRKLQGNSYLMD